MRKDYAGDKGRIIMNDFKLPVITCLDNKYIVPLASMVASLLENISKNVHIELFIIADQIPAKNKGLIEQIGRNKKVTFHWLDIDPLKFRGLHVDGYATRATYSQFFLAEMLPKSIKKAIFVAADALILDDLYQLWQVDLEGNHICACRDTIVKTVSTTLGVHNYRDLGFSKDAPYFNTGVLLIDMEKWRSDRIGLKALEYARKWRNKNPLWDQGALNAILYDKWKELDSKWNEFPRRVYAARSKNPSIIHFVTYVKPWKTLRRFASDEKEWFLEYIGKTPWKMEALLPRRPELWLEKIGIVSLLEFGGRLYRWSSRVLKKWIKDLIFTMMAQ